MDKSAKLYKHAIDYYNNGSINKALEICEKSISENMKNTSAINLKGLLYYLKGELDSAQILWKMNAEVNKDSVSRKYLEDSKNDEDRVGKYIQAQSYIKELRINDALECLKYCAESDFNAIKVNNSIALCYMRQGEYENALKYIEKTLSIDNINEEALASKQSLVELGIIDKELNFKPIIKITATVLGVVCITAIVIFLGRSGAGKLKAINISPIKNLLTGEAFKKKKPESNVPKKEAAKQQTDTAAKEQQKPESKPQPEQKSEVKQESFPTDAINRGLAQRNYDELYNITLQWRNKAGSDSEKELIRQADIMLTYHGADYFYNKALSLHNTGEDENAKSEFQKAYNYGRESDLYPHILYLYAVSSKNTGDSKNALILYEEYYTKYPKGEYADISLYELATLNTSDINVAKAYADKLIKTFPYSIYNNMNIADILAK